jgi:DNA adenine methylase
MVGGGSVFLRVKQIYPRCQYWINDINYELYCFWKMTRDNVGALVDAVREIKERRQDGRQLFMNSWRTMAPEASWSVRCVSSC